MGRARAFLAETLIVQATQVLCLHDRGVVMSTEQLTPDRKKGLAVCSAVITPLFLLWCPPVGSTDRDSQTRLTHNTATTQLIETHGASAASSQQGFSIKVFTSPDDQFWTNSIIVEGGHEVMLVDAQLTKTSAEKVLREIKETKKPLSLIYITHEHADHFLGLEVFKDAYPRARIIANSAVVDRINQVYREKIDKWKKIVGAGATSHVVAISKFDADFIDFDSSRIEVFKHIRGDTDENTMLWIPGQRILIAGDVVFNNMHVYTAETDSKAREKWLNSLESIRKLEPSVVIPGHSKVGAPLDASTAVDFTEKYLVVFEEELKKARDPDSLINAMKERFPSAGLVLALERGADANVKR
jgi:glyoxylase-like metal-dependent hydrolase (beta-lactamase superfamily II)